MVQKHDNNSLPLLKWPGGKRWAIPFIKQHTPKSFRQYIEPFFGGGATYFALAPKQALLSDINSELINFYTVTKNSPNQLSNLLQIHHANHTSDYYYTIRSSIFQDPIEQAARFLYLNRTCWNGLYRVNKKGEFNVPIGTKTNVTLDINNTIACSTMLKDAEITCCDFEYSIDKAQKNDFLFIDPPYTVAHNTNNFIKYNDELFSWKDQLRLCNAVQRALARGAMAIITNADHESVVQLFSSAGKYIRLSRNSVLSGTNNGRKKTTEAFFLCNIIE